MAQPLVRVTVPSGLEAGANAFLVDAYKAREQARNAQQDERQTAQPRKAAVN